MNVFAEVFQRYFITTHRYFQNKNAFNIGSELAAMGHHYYYMYTLAPSCISRMDREKQRAYCNEIINATHNDIVKAIEQGQISYGTTLHCAVPRQTTNPVIDPLISRHWSMLKNREVQTTDPQALKAAIRYRESVTNASVKRLYRWGYYQAIQMVHNNDYNRQELNQFYAAFEQVCKRDPAELAKHYTGIEFTVKSGIAVQWDARFISHGGTTISYMHFCK
jgi:hypothetical protein